MKLRGAVALLLIPGSLAAIASAARADSPRGQEEYLRYCSACHGERADGQGPVANVLDPRPPALRKLTPRYGSPLGTDLVAYVMGTTMPRAHGTSDMPVWGRNLQSPDGSDGKAVRIIWRIVDYLDSIQLARDQPESTRPDPALD
jgi:mono/diheme cytochrome c family protein